MHASRKYGWACNILNQGIIFYWTIKIQYSNWLSKSYLLTNIQGAKALK